MAKEVILEVSDVGKSFPGVNALENISIQFHKGEVHALLGENGAGKSTLMKILAGIHTPDSGTIRLRGKEVFFNKPKQSMEAGIGMVHQELCLCPHQTAAENVYMGRSPVNKFGFFDWKKLNADAQQIFAQLDMDVRPSDVVGNLSIAKQQMIEIAKAASMNASIIILDEPTSSVTEEERLALFNMIRRLKEKDVAIIYISHRMEEILEIADCFTILRDGHFIVTKPVEGITIDEIITGMVGRTLTYVEHEQSSGQDEPVMEAKGLTRRGVFENISFNVRKGEVLGLAGLVGAGRSEVARCIFGLDKMDSGAIWINGRECSIHSPRSAINYGVGFVTEDRKMDGSVLEMSVQENITLPILKTICKAGFINKTRDHLIARQAIENYGVKTPSPKQKVVNLSGGNQQKVIIAKWLTTNPKVLILDEPTRGIDVGAKNEIYKMINELTAKGLAVIMISSEMPEILRMSDRVIVMREGKITAEIPKKDATQDTIMRFAIQ
ncbi:MAG: sugar ABC transporter ATP-binding protein [Spirochaetales bacterium]|nr:sugar ABC transporter ATP-binding protein [Spirochaetales bacterium]